MSLKYSVLRGVTKLKKSGAIRFAKNAAIGTAAGYTAGRVVSPAGLSEQGGKSGAIAGGIVGGVLGLPHARVAKSAAQGIATFGRGLKATPGSRAGSMLRAAESSARDAQVIFRRIRGRIVAIRRKA